MKLSEFKTALQGAESLNFQLEDGTAVPAHFHITEIGRVTKKFIDCGGTLRDEERVTFQLWFDEDFHHRLSAEKLMSIIKIGEEKIGLPNIDIEVEYQSTTIGKYSLQKGDFGFILANSQTACLAPDKCGIPVKKESKQLVDLVKGSCDPKSGCC